MYTLVLYAFAAIGLALGLAYFLALLFGGYVRVDISITFGTGVELWRAIKRYIKIRLWNK